MPDQIVCPKCSYIRKPSDTAPISECPACGVIYERYKPRATVPPRDGPARKKGTNPLVAAAMVVIVFVVAWMYGTSVSQRQAPQEVTLQDIHNQVVNDSLAQYQIVKRSGTAVDVCVHAGLVSAAYLQAKNEAAYQQWKSIEAQDCRQAGIGK